MNPYFHPELKLFPGNPESYKGIREIFSGIWAVLRDRKTAETRTEFRESIRVLAKSTEIFESEGSLI